MTMRFLDTNTLIAYFTRDDEQKAQQALALLQRLEDGRERVVTSPLVIFEVVFTLQRRYKEPKKRVAALVLPLLGLPGLQLANKALWRQAFRFYTTYPVGFADAYNAAYMQSVHVSEIYTWDEG